MACFSKESAIMAAVRFGWIDVPNEYTKKSISLLGF
jgi:hypothetical protein